MTFRLVHEPPGEWHFGIWRIEGVRRSMFSLRLFKWALVWSSE
jgi:hypothetical protein